MARSYGQDEYRVLPDSHTQIVVKHTVQYLFTTNTLQDCILGYTPLQDLDLLTCSSDTDHADSPRK